LIVGSEGGLVLLTLICRISALLPNIGRQPILATFIDIVKRLLHLAVELLPLLLRVTAIVNY